MARATHTSSTDAPRDAIALLKQDHRAVEALFSEFEDADESEQSELATRICQMLTVHAQIEEELLYPQAKEALEEQEEDDMVYEAEIEHASAKELIAKIEAATPEDPEFKALVTVLMEYVKHHVKEEEKEMFPKLKQTELDLKEMGSQLAQRKMQLMEQMGIEAEEPPAPRRKRSTGSRASASKRSQARAGSRSKSARSSGSRARH